MATTTFTPSMLRGAGTRGIPEIPAGSSFSNLYSMAFDGVDEYMTTGLNLAFASVPNFSISYWIKTDASLTNFASYFAIGINVTYNSSAYNYSAGRLYKQATKLVVSIQGSGTKQGTTQLDDGDWHHIMQVYTDNGNNTSRVRIYVDGNSTPEVDLASTLSYAPLTSDLFIGARNASNDRAFPGNIDEVSVFNSDQSSNLSTIYNSGIPGDLSSLTPLGWWRQGENGTWDGSKWTLVDQGSGGNNAESNNMEEADRKSDVPN